MPPDWAAVRREFPSLSRWTYLNTATYGQLPRCAIEAVTQHFRRRDESACADFLDWFSDMDTLRASVGKLIHCSPDDVAFVGNAASGLGLLLGGIPWRPGDRIVTLEGEFPNNIYYPALLAQRGVEFLETSWENFSEAVNERTRLVLMSSANYSTGFRPPLEEIGRLLRERGVLFFLDGTQSVGALRLDVPAIRPHMLVVDAYKWLLGPNGSGFLYVCPELRRTLQPNVIGWRSHSGWRGVDALHHGAPQFVEAAEKYEGGMLSFPSLYGMAASINLMLGIGLDQIEARVFELAGMCCSALQRLGGTVLHPDSHILAARFPGVDASELAVKLRDRGVLVSARHGCLRVSPHFYNEESDVARFEETLESLLG